MIERLAHSLAALVVGPALSAPARQGVLRLLMGLQRFPLMTPGLAVTLSWTVGEGHASIGMSSEHLALSYCSTRLQYFAASHQLFDCGSLLEGDERDRFLKDWASIILHVDEHGGDVSVEDLSQGEAVDVPHLLVHGCIVDDEGDLDFL